MQINMVIWSVVAASPGKVMLTKPAACFAVCTWRTACDLGDGALLMAAGEQTLVPSFLCLPAGLIALSVPVHDAASYSRFWICSVVQEPKTQIHPSPNHYST